MKWFSKPAPKIGDTRIITRFALFPITIKNETRWLEIVYIIQKYELLHKQDYNAFHTWNYEIERWINIGFTNFPEKD